MEVMQDPGPYQPEHRGRHHDELTDHGGSDDGLAEAEAEDVQYDQSDILAALRQLRHDYELLLRENRSMEEYCEEVGREAFEKDQQLSVIKTEREEVVKELVEIRKELEIIPLMEQKLTAERSTVVHLRKQIQISASTARLDAHSGGAVLQAEIARLEQVLEGLSERQPESSDLPSTPAGRTLAPSLNDSGFNSRPGTARQTPMPRSRLEGLLEDTQHALDKTRDELSTLQRQHEPCDPKIQSLQQELEAALAELESERRMAQRLRDQLDEMQGSLDDRNSELATALRDNARESLGNETSPVSLASTVGSLHDELAAFHSEAATISPATAELDQAQARAGDDGSATVCDEASVDSGAGSADVSFDRSFRTLGSSPALSPERPASPDGPKLSLAVPSGLRDLICGGQPGTAAEGLAGHKLAQHVSLASMEPSDSPPADVSAGSTQDAESKATVPPVGPRRAVTETAARFDFKANDARELSLTCGERLIVMRGRTSEQWWLVRNTSGLSGFVPVSYLDLPSTVKAEVHLQREQAVPTDDASAKDGPSPRKKRGLLVFTRYEYLAKNDKELSFKRGERLLVARPILNKRWWEAENSAGTKGFVPTNFLKFRASAAEAFYGTRWRRGDENQPNGTPPATPGRPVKSGTGPDSAAALLPLSARGRSPAPNRGGADGDSTALRSFVQRGGAAKANVLSILKGVAGKTNTITASVAVKTRSWWTRKSAQPNSFDQPGAVKEADGAAGSDGTS